MLPLNVTLSYYKRPDIQAAMVAQCRGKEVAVRYGDRFGKRPDTLVYDKDVLKHAQKRATSFHVSEETWSNVMMLDTGMRRNELNDARVGWDLVLDIDFPAWEATRIIADALVKQLRKEGVPEHAITAKFSGNKGFHIAVPYEAFPDTYVDDDGNEVLVSDFFPEGVRTMVEYIVHRADGPGNNYALSEALVKTIGFDKLKDSLIVVDTDTGRQRKDVSAKGNEFVCPKCEYRTRSEEEYLECPKCGALLTPVLPSTEATKRTRTKVNLEIDTLLVSSRHMYRLVYSLHEKSGLASIPVPLHQLLTFDKTRAQPDVVKTETPFLDRNVDHGCATQLFLNALKFKPPGADEKKEFSEIVWDQEAAPEESFPPPIKKMFAGMSDGRKRALFVLTNFLRSVGWNYDMIRERLDTWNEANTEPLRSNLIEQHLRYHQQKNESVLPPNFDNDMYYKDLGVLVHDELSERVKNPVQYVRLRLKQTMKPEQRRKGTS